MKNIQRLRMTSIYTILQYVYYTILNNSSILLTVLPTQNSYLFQTFFKISCYIWNIILSQYVI